MARLHGQFLLKGRWETAVETLFVEFAITLPLSFFIVIFYLKGLLSKLSKVVK